MTAENLAQVLRLELMSISRLAKSGILTRTKNEKGIYDYPAKNIGDYIDFLRKRASGRNSPAKERILNAEASIKERQDMTEAKELVPLAEYEANYKDAIAQGMTNISRLRTLTKQQKESVFVAIRAVRLAPPDFSESEKEDEAEQS